ncbi:response regulator transcription factor [Actinacidiphila acidipaludis]|uniref:Response regulator transcription factor n=1 Tax=Actinacidiphila acidipaludis TaxID=2873382 RepID=A0ABS7QBN0_9ACTN|nr:response regulator transcription factor [Streptomyces acidipaludis]MBY8880585.1 response regulator transcription factor [Streptomyces acidipaludis]
MSEEGNIRVFLLDDHEVVRRSVHDLLSAADGMDIVGEAANAAEAPDRIPATHPDVAVLDVRLPEGANVEICREVRSHAPGVACLMLTSYADDEALFDAVMAGAAGFVPKVIRGQDLIQAVREVAAGHTLLDPADTAKVMERLRGGGTRSESVQVEDVGVKELTSDERQILDLIGEGLTNRQIGERLGQKERRVRKGVTSILAKLATERHHALG